MEERCWFRNIALMATCVALLPVLIMALLPLLLLAPVVIALLLPVAAISALGGTVGVRSDLTVSGVRSARAR